MWILYFQGKSSYWLTGSRAYTVGRKDNDIVVVDDASISRCHVTIDIGASVVDRLDSSTPCLSVVAAALSSRAASSSQGVYSQSRQPSSSQTNCAPAQLTRPYFRITDSSKYGTSVVLKEGTAATPLKNGETFIIPSGVSSFQLHLGTHGMMFHVVYEPVRICVSNVAELTLPSLEASVARLGFHLVKDAAQCDVFMTDALEPTQDLVVAMCSAKPLVLPAFLDAVLGRKNCKVPLPDAAERRFLPPVDSFWFQLAKSSTPQDAGTTSSGAPPSADAVDAAQQLFLPKRERKYLFAEMAFVCIQQSLFDEVAQYLAAARGRAVLDEALWDTLGNSKHPTEAKTKLQAFCLRHKQHVLLYTTADRLPAPIAALEQLFTSTGNFGVTLVEYSALLRCILLVQRLVIAPLVVADDGAQHVGANANTVERRNGTNHDGIGVRSDTTMTRATTVATMATSPQQSANGGRKTGQLLFAEEDDDDSNGRGAQGGVAPEALRTPWLEPAAGGWRDGLGGSDHDASIAPANSITAAKLNSDVKEERVPIQHKLRLPSYPCFQAYTATAAGRAGSALPPQQIGTSGKLFQKQAVTVSSRYAEYEAVKPTTVAEQALTSRIGRLDATNMFDDEVLDLVGKEKRFNTFDTAEQHTTHRRQSAAAKKAPAAAAKKAKGPPPAQARATTVGGRPAQGGAAQLVAHDDVADDMSQSAAPPPRGGRVGGPIDIFSVDALF